MSLDTLTRAVAAQESEPIGIVDTAHVEHRSQHGRTVAHPPHRLPIFKASAEWRKEVNAGAFSRPAENDRHWQGW
jgi:hypothetical protein